MSAAENEVNDTDLSTGAKSDGLLPLLKRLGCLSEISVFWFNPGS